MINRGARRMTQQHFWSAGQDPDTDPIEEKVTFTYDGRGRRTRVLHEDIANTRTVSDTTYSFDETTGQLTKVVSLQGTINYEYDTLGQLTRTWTGTDSQNPGTDTRYVYDNLGRLTDVEVHARFGSNLVTPEVTTYHYDFIGRLIAVEQANGVVASYEYDQLDRIDLLTHFIDTDSDLVLDTGEIVLASFDYTLRADGRRTQVTEQFDTDADETVDVTNTFTWAYDGLNRLISETLDSDEAADYAVTYSFDLVSNRVQMEKDDGNDSSIDATTMYVYDHNDRLLTETTDATGTAIDRHTVYAYSETEQTGKAVYEGLDDQGTLLSQTTMTYNLQGRLATVEIDSDGDTNIDTATAYTYDSDGIRVTQEVTENSTTTTTEYLIDANNPTGYAQVIEEYVDSVLAKGYVIGYDVIAQADGTNGVLTLLYDAHGSTRALLDTVADVIQRYSFDAYGNHLAGSGLVALANALTTLLYSGELSDTATGFQYLRARYYDPVSGRFNRMDSWAGNVWEPMSLHKYSYGHGDSINGIDPTGYMTLSDVLATVRQIARLIDKFITPVRKVFRRAFGDKEWDVYVAGRFLGVTIPPWHMFIFVEHRSTLAGARFDVTSGSGLSSKLLGFGSAKLKVIPTTRASLVTQGYRFYRIARFSDRQFALYSIFTTAGTMYLGDLHRTVRLTLPFGYIAPIPPWALNCTEWTVAAAVVAKVISILPLK